MIDDHHRRQLRRYLWGHVCVVLRVGGRKIIGALVLRCAPFLTAVVILVVTYMLGLWR